MSSLSVLIIRHAEKPEPDQHDLGPGLTADGKESPHSLIIRGWQRAGAWAVWFGSGAGGPDFPKPDIVYAADPKQSSSQDKSHSKRPHETILPLCHRLHIAPITQYGVDAEAAMVRDVLQLAGTVLICWEHKKIIEALIPALTNGQNLPQLPAKWDGTRFDVILRFDRAQSGAPWSFRQLFPRLLAGDLDLPVDQAA